MRSYAGVVALFLLSVSVLNGQFESNRDTLRGLSGVIVLTNLNSGAQSFGLATTTVQTDVEVKLRIAGIPVLTLGKETPGDPLLLVSINALDLKDKGAFVYIIHAELLQDVLLGRNGFALRAATWEGGSYYGVASSQDEVRGHLKDMIDKFVNDFLSVNPKK